MKVVLLILIIFGIVLFSERTAMKKQRGGSGEAMGVLIVLLILGIVGGLVWHFTRDNSSPTPTPTLGPDNQNNGNGNDNSHGDALTHHSTDYDDPDIIKMTGMLAYPDQSATTPPTWTSMVSYHMNAMHTGQSDNSYTSYTFPAGIHTYIDKVNYCKQIIKKEVDISSLEHYGKAPDYSLEYVGFSVSPNWASSACQLFTLNDIKDPTDDKIHNTPQPDWNTYLLKTHESILQTPQPTPYISNMTTSDLSDLHDRILFMNGQNTETCPSPALSYCQVGALLSNSAGDPNISMKIEDQNKFCEYDKQQAAAICNVSCGNCPAS